MDDVSPHATDNTNLVSQLSMHIGIQIVFQKPGLMKSAVVMVAKHGVGCCFAFQGLQTKVVFKSSSHLGYVTSRTSNVPQNPRGPALLTLQVPGRGVQRFDSKEHRHHDRGYSITLTFAAQHGTGKSAEILLWPKVLK